MRDVAGPLLESGAADADRRLAALANPRDAPCGIPTALLPLSKLGRLLNNNCDGDGKPGEDDIIAGAADGGVVAITERDGEDERITTFIVAMAGHFNLHSRGKGIATLLLQMKKDDLSAFVQIAPTT